MFKKSTSFLLLLTSLAFVSACKKDDEAPATTNMMTLSAVLDGKQEVPTPNASTATGTMTGTFDKTTRVLTYTVTYQGITPTSGHIHRGAAGTVGDPFVAFASVATSPITGTATLSEADAATLLAGESYVNLHTNTYKAGEIRGTVQVK